MEHHPFSGGLCGALDTIVAHAVPRHRWFA
jgi:hypothetical protein